MTGTEIYKRAAAFAFQSSEDAEDTNEFAAEWLNTILCEALPYENALRRFDGAQELTAAPYIKALDEDINWHDSILSTAVPFAMAAHIWRADDNDYRANMFQQMYVNALSDTQRLYSEDIVQMY